MSDRSRTADSGGIMPGAGRSGMIIDPPFLYIQVVQGLQFLHCCNA